MVSRHHYARMDIQCSETPCDSYAEKKGPGSYGRAMAQVVGQVGRATSQELLLKKLDDQVDDLVVKILLKMIEPDFQKRWSADQCLGYGLQSVLVKIATDGRIVGVDDPDEKDDEDNGDDGTKTPTTRSSRTQAMNVGGSAVQRSKRRDLDRSVDGTDIFGTNWLRDPNCVGSDVAALGDDVDEEGSRLKQLDILPFRKPYFSSALR